MTTSDPARPATDPASGAGEPIAIVGMACRFPGAADLDAFWRLLEEGENAVTEAVPGDGRGRMGLLFGEAGAPDDACRYGAFVDDIEQFDAAFFRISPVEAELLDPQQRMMLETSWLALEDAGIDPAGLRESRTGVYTGISNDEYRWLVVDTTRPGEAAGSLYALSGTNMNGASGRVSFVLGLMGPAKAVDAACASAMVAVHDAVSDLQQGKADLAIAGGVQAMLNGRIYELRAEAMMLAPDGRCKTFDASADGYVRGEGCGVVVLKRLRDAEAAGDRIWAVIRGVAVNHGGASVGLTVPHTPALVRVMEDALADAGVAPAEIDYLEAHGTGTAVGDPVEINAAATVFSRGRDDDEPLLVGSVKTNIGHLESAAGIAGLMKAALALKRGVIPKHLHFRDPNPRLDWDGLPLRVTSQTTDWPRRGDRPRLAGVNSFGISGTNAHIVVEEHRGRDGAAAEDRGAAGPAQAVAASLPAGLPPPEGPLAPRRARVLPLSGKSAGAVRDLAARYLAWLDDRAAAPGSGAIDALLADMAWTAGAGRSHFDHRTGVVFEDAASLRARLAEVAGGGADPEPRSPGAVAFVYTGQGSQWAGMGRALYESEPVARAVLDRCEAVFREVRGASLLGVMFGRGGASGDLGDTAWEQPALYALECALTALWASVGVRPAVVVGHSVGEIAAAQAAGVFGLEDGMRFAAARGALLSGMAGGGMAAVFAPADEVTDAVAAHNAACDGPGLSVAADNGAHKVVSGPVADVEAVSARFEAREVRVRRLNTAKAFHSALVEPVLDGLEAALAGVEMHPPQLTVISNLTGRAVEPGMALDAGYWRRHAREAVAFAGGVAALAELGVDLVVEIGPDSVLGTMATLAWPSGPGAPAAPPALASLRRPPRDGSSPAPESGFADAVAAAYEAGLEIGFDGLFAGEARRRISLPGYPFQRERHWLDRPRQRRLGAGHPLLGARHESAGGEITFETDVFPSDPAWLPDHRVFGRVVMPGAVYGAMAASAALAEAGGAAVVVEDMQLHSALVFPADAETGDGDGAEEAGRTMQVVLDAGDRGSSRRVQVFSKGSEEGWTLHVEGRVAPGAAMPEAGGRADLEELKARLSPADAPAYYRAKAATGIHLGPSFRTLARVWAGPGEALAEVVLPESLGRNDLALHPLLLDGCFQAVGVARNMSGAEGEATYLPFGWDRMWLPGRLPDRVLCHVRMSEASQEAEAAPGDPPEVLGGEVRIYDANGAPLGGLSGYAVKRATRAALLSALEGVRDLLYEVNWSERALAPGLRPADFFPGAAAVAAGADGFADYLARQDVDAADRAALLSDLERWSWSYALAALEQLGWRRRAGETIDPEELRERLDVLEEHGRLVRRMFELLAKAGVVAERDGGFVVRLGADDPLPESLPADPDGFAAWMTERYAHGQIEIGLFQRCGRALAGALRGDEDPLALLFSSGEPTAGDLYLKAPVGRAANRLLGDAVRALVAGLPEGRRLRVLEVGAGTGSATASVLPELPEGRFDYTYTDISAGFFAEAEARFGDGGGAIDYRPLDIERDPLAQGFAPHGYDLIVASNVLHATRDLGETLANCLSVLAPSGQLVALENMRAVGWMDLTFGQLDGWWRFADDYRADHPLMGPATWRRALADVGFEEAEVLGPDEDAPPETLDKGVIVARGPARVTEPPGAWIVTAGEGGLAEALAAALAARDQTVVLAGGAPADGDEPPADGPGVRRVRIDATDRESWRSLIAGLPAGAPFNGVVHLTALDGHGEGASAAEVAGDVTRATASALAMVQAVADSDLIPARGLWFVTRGAQVLEEERGGELAGATLWGMGKAVTLEAPHLRPRMLDLEPAAAASMPDLVNELLYPDRENHIAYRGGQRLTARLVRPESAAPRPEPPGAPEWGLSGDRTYLVTGGLGGIGIAVAAWMAEHGAGAIVLNGRRDPDPEAAEAIEALREAGARVEVELADMTDTAAIDAMLARIDARLPPLGGVIHSVGVLADAALTNQTWERFETVLRPKIVGAWHLHRATLDRDLDMFLLFSSRVGVIGNPGQANHAAANAFLDQLAGHRRALGLPGQAIAWGAWSEIGEAAEQRERIERQRASRGGRWFTPQQGIRALERLVRQDAVASVVMSMDWSVFEEAVEDRPAFLEEMLSAASAAADLGPAEDLLSRLRDAPPAEHEDVLASFLQAEVRAVLRLPTAPAATVGFFDLGMDSLMAVELRNRLNRAFAGEYVASNTVVFDYPDIESLATHLTGELGPAAGGGAPARADEPAAAERRRPPASGEDGIAVVGMACRFPGAPDLASFWELLAAGRDAVTDGRRDGGAWSGAVGAPDAEGVDQRRGAFVDAIDMFDSRFFRIAPIEARTMDPRQRMMLETSWEALEDAGLDPAGLRGSRTGVYAGVGGSEYRDLIEASRTDQSYLGTTGSVTVGRVAFALGLEGPAIPLDLACASSLAAVHQAAVALQRGEVDLALAGGVNVVLSPSISRFMMDLGMLSPTGRCRPFDAAADGYVRGEGCGMIALKRLRDAEAGGDRIWGVIRGSAVNQNGASAALTVPNGPAQERVMTEALAQAGIRPEEVDYLEAHATGSQLGDPIELQAAAAVYGAGRDPDRPLIVGSVKSNIGHTESAAGMAALIKTLLAMNRGVIPKHLHFDEPNPHVEWTQLPLRAASQATDWPGAGGRPRVAGVNAFGLSGANAHVLVEGYAPVDGLGSGLPAGGPRPVPVSLPQPVADLPAPAEEWSGRPARLLPLAGRSAPALRDLAGRYLAWLDGEDGAACDERLSDLAWTAGVGRSHFDYRAGLPFRDGEELRRGLRAVAARDAAPDDPPPEAATKVAFAYGGGAWPGMGAELYASEPVARAVLERCDALIREERAASLLDVMFGQAGLDEDLCDPAWAAPAGYALACALTALWASVGVRPAAVVGSGSGGLAAAQAAGVLSLEDGLRLAAALGAGGRDGLEAALGDVAVAAPSVPLVDSVTGELVEPAAVERLLRDDEPADRSACAAALSRLGVDAVVDVGPGDGPGPAIGAAWPGAEPVVLRAPDDGDASTPGCGFVGAVAGAYEAGLDIAFAGLFAGESRRRVALPGYPFQRRRHWI